MAATDRVRATDDLFRHPVLLCSRRANRRDRPHRSKRVRRRGLGRGRDRAKQHPRPRSEAGLHRRRRALADLFDVPLSVRHPGDRLVGGGHPGLADSLGDRDSGLCAGGVGLRNRRRRGGRLRVQPADRHRLFDARRVHGPGRRPNALFSLWRAAGFRRAGRRLRPSGVFSVDAPDGDHRHGWAGRCWCCCRRGPSLRSEGVLGRRARRGAVGRRGRWRAA